MTDAFAQSALNAAVLRLQAGIGAAVERLADLPAFGTTATGALRQTLSGVQVELRRKLPVFNLEFATVLRDKVRVETAPRQDARRTLASTTWESLSLVDDDEVDERVAAERISLELAHGCEWELRDLDSYIGALQRVGRPDPEHNPLRPEIVAQALLSAIRAVSDDAEHRQHLSREIGRTLGPALKVCYGEIAADLRSKGVRPAGLAVRTVQGPGNDLPREALREGSGYQTSGFGTTSTREMSSAAGALSAPMSNAAGATPGPGAGGDAGPLGFGDMQMLAMMRRLAFMGGGGPPSGLAAGIAERGPAKAGNSVPDALGDLMAVNLIRQHRDDLVRASGGTLDHMVIDVVAAMFDHLLADPKVPPQLARQIGRLQMPVLRAALKDNSFFSSRRHPVRRFVNRVASLASAYEDLDEGPGKQFIERVRQLVQEIVEGDFDQMELYEGKLQAIEALIEEQSGRDVGSHANAARLLDGRETQLRIQQRYMLELRGKLHVLELAPYLSDFLSQVWSQVQVQAAGPDGSPELAHRTREVARELVMSVQPKGTPQLRRDFLMKLPQLMKDLNEGLARIRWPEVAKGAFFAQLLPAHAASLKTPPLTDFFQRQLKFKLDQLDKVAIPRPEDVHTTAPAPLPAVEEHAAPLQLSPEDAQRIGFVEESAVDWSGAVDIDLGETAAGDSGTSSGEVDLEIDPLMAEGAPPTHGPQLIHHLQTGIAYRMYLEGRWQRVRLNWVSPGRAFFVFTHGKAHEKTISMTSRMLTKLCDAERFRAYEQAELIERATSRARAQLAKLTAASRQAALNSR